MASTAQVAQLSKFYISGTAGSAITITGITKANPAVVTATNTLSVGDVVIFGSVTNMPEINGMLGIVTVASGSSFTVAIDASGFANAGTSGTCTPQTFKKIGNVKDFTPDGGTATVLDVTNMDSTAKEKRQGLQDMGNMSMTFDVDDTDVGQLQMIASRTAQSISVFKVVYPGSLNRRVFQGFVQKIADPVAGVDKVLSSSATIVVTGPIYRG